ncbi:MAG TPA: pyruvate dehydrogenase (acetyl-transferring) E1 component subunit alpha [Acidimicrobiia bacterium]|nr:pyruvate dehydrogenase (acetyl-transferring) E1 component subunit alpha [Acidimicrobiia bacterium]
MTIDIATQFAMRQVLTPDGSVVGEIPPLSDSELTALYRLMLRARVFDRRALAAQRQGRLGTYPMLEGQEAAQVGSAAALGSNDFVYPAYREHGVLITRGMPIEVMLAYWKGLPASEWDVHRYGIMTHCVPIASHLPHAVGHAYAARQRGEDVVTVAYLGDGATSETDFHSGLNFAGVWKTPTVFVCENNSYAISVPYAKQTASATIAQKALAYGIEGVRVDGMDVLAVYEAMQQAVARARNGDGPTLIEAVCYRYGPHATADDARRYRSEVEEKEWRDKDPLDRYRVFLAGRGLWDEELETAALEAAESEVDAAMAKLEAIPEPDRGSVIRHAYERIPRLIVDQLHASQRARGETPSSYAADDLWHVGEETLPDGPTERWTMAEALNAAMHEAMEADPAMLIQGEDVGLTGGVFRITERLQQEYGEERVIDTPLNESGIVGTAIGMAISGSRTIAEIQFDGFVYPAFDQIVSHLGRIRFRSQGHATLPLVVRFPNGAGIGAHEHHCDSPEAYFAHAPGLVVVIPSRPIDAKGLLAAALESSDPVIFLEPKVLYRAGREDVPTQRYTVPLGKARIARRGTDLTLVTYGGLMPAALAAAEAAMAEGVDTEVIDLRTIYPWDVETVQSSVENTGRLLVVQEPQRTGGIAAEVAAEIAERSAYSLEGPVRRIGATDAPWPQFAIESHALLGQDEILQGIRDTVAG